jgi:hypothetical protein
MLIILFMNMNIHDVVEPRDIFFQQHWDEYYYFLNLA